MFQGNKTQPILMYTEMVSNEIQTAGRMDWWMDGWFEQMDG